VGALDGLDVPGLIASCSLMAPACSTAFYEQHYAPRLREPAGGGRDAGQPVRHRCIPGEIAVAAPPWGIVHCHYFLPRPLGRWQVTTASLPISSTGTHHETET
jgi:hypothetical protein